MTDPYGRDTSTEDETSPPVEETFAASTDGEAAEPQPEDSENDDLATVVAQRDEYLDSLRRLQADFDNYRKRAVRQQTEFLERASEGLVVQLLPVLDALDLAQAHASTEDAAGRAALEQIATLLRDTLQRQGLERIDTVGVPFDPTVHDAVAHEEATIDEPGEIDEEGGGEQDEDGSPSTPSHAAPTISEVMRAGYRLKGRVVRPAMVKVKG